MIGDRKCGLYVPGHQVHWIQARKASADRGVPADVLGVENDVLVFAVGDGLRLFTNHHPERVVVLAREHGEVALIERWGILRIGRGHLFSVASLEPALRECPPPPFRLEAPC